MEEKEADRLLQPGKFFTLSKEGAYSYIIERDDPILKVLIISETGSISGPEYIDLDYFRGSIINGGTKEYEKPNTDACTVPIIAGLKFTRANRPKTVYKVVREPSRTEETPLEFVGTVYSDGSMGWIGNVKMCVESIKLGFIAGNFTVYNPAPAESNRRFYTVEDLKKGFTYSINGTEYRITKDAGNLFFDGEILLPNKQYSPIYGASTVDLLAYLNRQRTNYFEVAQKKEAQEQPAKPEKQPAPDETQKWIDAAIKWEERARELESKQNDWAEHAKKNQEDRDLWQRKAERFYQEKQDFEKSEEYYRKLSDIYHQALRGLTFNFVQSNNSKVVGAITNGVFQAEQAAAELQRKMYGQQQANPY